MIKRYLLIIGFFLFSFSCVQSAKAEAVPKAIEYIETGEEVEVKDFSPKMFIYDALQLWLTLDSSDLYFKQYQAKRSVEMEGLKPENVRIWIKDIKSKDRNYTHLVTVLLPYENVIVDGKKQMKTVDKFTYAVNANQLTVCQRSDGLRDCVKLINSYHKVIAK